MAKAIKALLGLLVLVGIAYVAWWLGSAMLKAFLGLNPTTMTAIAGLTGLLLVPIVTYFTTRSLERRRSLENAVREHKTKLYDELIRGLMRMLNLQKLKETMRPDEMQEFFASITPPLISYGSRGVIRNWNAFRKISRENIGDTSAIMLGFEGLLKAMRQDLGHNSFSHRPGELLGIFINDVDEILKKKKNNKLPATEETPNSTLGKQKKIETPDTGRTVSIFCRVAIHVTAVMSRIESGVATARSLAQRLVEAKLA